MARKSENKINGKIIGLFLGIALTLSILGTINLVYASAHGNEMAMQGGMMRMMMRGGMMPGDMMHGNDMAMEETELKEMLQHMDKDNDGLCDHCGTSVDACGEMMTSLG